MTEPIRSVYSFPHAVGAAGIGTTALHQIRGLVAAGVEVSLVCTSLEADLPASVRVLETLRIFGKRLPHRIFGNAQRAYDYHDYRVARFLSGSLRPPDLVHVWPRSCLRSMAAARQRGIVTLRELPNAHTASVFEESERAAREAGVELPNRHSHRKDSGVLTREEAEFDAADYLLSPSDYVRSSFESRGFDRDRLRDTRYGFDPSRFTPATGRAERPFTAVFLGRADPTKGLHLALAAWERSGIGDRGRFLIFGRLTDSFAQALRHELTLPGVEFRGFVQAPENELRAADVLVLPSYTEGSALVTYEAMGSGCLPLVSTSSGAPIQAGVTGFTHEVGDVETLGRQLAVLASSPRRLAQLRQACLAEAAGLTWDAAGRRLAEVYREVMARRPGAVLSRPGPTATL